MLEKREVDQDRVDEDRIVRLMRSVPSAVEVELGYLQDSIGVPVKHLMDATGAPSFRKAAWILY